MEIITIVSTKSLKWQKIKCGIDEVLKLVEHSLEENISQESAD